MNLLLKVLIILGYFLKDGLSDDVAFLPHENCDQKLMTNQRVDVFIYLDNENNLIASTKKPIAIVGEFGVMSAVSSIK